MLKAIWTKINKPLPGWLTLLLLFSAIPAVASYPVYWGHWMVSDASATPSPAPTGYAGPVVVAQATSAPTIQPGYLNVANILQNGVPVTTTGSGVTSLSCSANIICSPSTAPTPSIAVTAAPSFTSVTSTNGLTSGSSTYGPTSATVNGNVTANAGQFGGLISAPANTTTIGSGGGNSAIRTGSGSMIFQDATGVNNWLILNGTSGTFQGSVIAGAQVKGCQSASCTQTYLPPVYTASGGAVASTLHGTTGTFSCTTGTVSAVGWAACTQTINFSGAAVFAGASSYGCSYVITTNSSTGTLTTPTNPMVSNSTLTLSGSTILITPQTYVSAVTVSGTITMGGTYICFGT